MMFLAVRFACFFIGTLQCENLTIDRLLSGLASDTFDASSIAYLIFSTARPTRLGWFDFINIHAVSQNSKDLAVVEKFQ